MTLLNHMCQSDAFYLPHGGGTPFSPSPQQETHHTSHLAYTGKNKNKNFWIGVPEVFLSHKPSVVFPPSQGNPVQGPQICLTSNKSGAGVRHNLCLKTRMSLPMSLVRPLAKISNSCLLLCKVAALG